ncbi:hypothetical protein ACN20G_30305 (plasmid) [Streptomyces sp. BI20]|uniref:hypothetical protein n=1 Tax=Streptomyces sp. BI20 TaxID=3403460 RepID=UPI003C722DAD
MTARVPEAPRVVNPYGVRVPVLGNRLSRGPLPPPRDDHPLVPWEEPDHVRQWVDVDHAGEQLRVFDECLQRLDEALEPSVDRGRLLVVTGPSGMGKTTLIHRCIHLARRRVEEYTGGAVREDGLPELLTIVAMTGGYENGDRGLSTDDNGDFAPASSINALIRDKVVGVLRRRFDDAGLFPNAAEEAPAKTFGAIGDLLEEQSALLFVVVPNIEWRDAGLRTKFLRTCLGHAKSRVFLFVEVTHADRGTAHEVLRELPRDPAITHLSLGSLLPADVGAFARGAADPDPEQHGYAPPEQPAPDGPPPPDPSSWQPADVRALRQACHAVAERQLRENRPVRVTAEALLAHHAGRDRTSLLDGLRRHSAGPAPTAPPHPPDPEPGPEPGPPHPRDRPPDRPPAAGGGSPDPAGRPPRPRGRLWSPGPP